MNKRVVITGANGAIGSSIAKKLSGHRLLLIGSNRNTQQLEQVAENLKAEAFISADFESSTSISETNSKILETLGGVDVLVNCAGIAIDNLFLRVSDDEWNRQIQVNLTAAWKMSQFAALQMSRQKWGRIISISSVIGHLGNKGQCAYAASKAGLLGMTRSLAREVASRGVTVNTISPGFIISAMTQHILDNKEFSQKLLETIPAGQFGKPEDVSDAVAFLIDAPYVTGVDIPVSGGMFMN